MSSTAPAAEAEVASVMSSDHAASIHSFYSSTPAPPSLSTFSRSLRAFLSSRPADAKVIAITSGGTRVPLEQNMVRFVDNFSSGQRGASMAEHFLDAGYHVIFLHREGSALPFVRRIAWLIDQREKLIAKQTGAAAPSATSSGLNSFAMLRALHVVSSDSSSPQIALHFTDADHAVLPHARAVLDSVHRFQKPEQQSRFLALEFGSVAEYLFGLRELCTAMRDRFATGSTAASAAAASSSTSATASAASSSVSPALQRRCMLVLAAAVSDYHIPAAAMALHKMESRAGPLQLSMEQTPKVLHALRHGMIKAQQTNDGATSETAGAEAAWLPHAFAVSFKLETDNAVLLRKATAALRSHRVNAVVANMLHTRYQQVQLVTASSPQLLAASQPASDTSAEEEAGVQTLVRAAPLAGAAASTGEEPLEFDVEIEVQLVAALVAAHDAWIKHV